LHVLENIRHAGAATRLARASVLTGKAAGLSKRVRPSDTEYMHAIDTDDAQR